VKAERILVEFVIHGRFEVIWLIFPDWKSWWLDIWIMESESKTVRITLEGSKLCHLIDVQNGLETWSLWKKYMLKERSGFVYNSSCCEAITSISDWRPWRSSNCWKKLADQFQKKTWSKKIGFEEEIVFPQNESRKISLRTHQSDNWNIWRQNAPPPYFSVGVVLFKE